MVPGNRSFVRRDATRPGLIRANKTNAKGMRKPMRVTPDIRPAKGRSGRGPFCQLNMRLNEMPHPAVQTTSAITGSHGCDKTIGFVKECSCQKFGNHLSIG